MSESLDSASESVYPRLLYFVDDNVDLQVLPFNTKDVKHAVYPLGCMPSLVSDFSNSKVKVSPGNEIVGPCYESFNL